MLCNITEGTAHFPAGMHTDFTVIGTDREQLNDRYTGADRRFR